MKKKRNQVNKQEKMHSSIVPSLAAKTARQHHVLWHNGNALCVNAAEIRVLKQSHEVCLCCLLKRGDRRRLETQIGLEILRNLAHKSLKRQFADQQIGAFLKLANLAQCNRAGTKAVAFLGAATQHCCLACCHRYGMRARLRLTAYALARRLFGASHSAFLFLQRALADEHKKVFIFDFSRVQHVTLFLLPSV